MICIKKHILYALKFTFIFTHIGRESMFIRKEEKGGATHGPDVTTLA
jgi:hypothetical protein